MTPSRSPLLLAACIGLATLAFLLPVEARDQWTPERANGWYARQPWLAGCNFTPSTAINPLEMWQAETFDPATIDRELGWAEGLGFNSVRVFLHHIPWQQDSRGYLRRIDRFLDIAHHHHIGVMFVLFDAVWDPVPHAGPQPAPRPGVHNSGWVQSPGAEILGNPARHDELKGYVQGVIGRFKGDRRVHAWDLFNEPDNDNRNSYSRTEIKEKAARSFELLEKTFGWARAMNPAQPLTAGVWLGTWKEASKLSRIERLMLESSDVITFHSYAPRPEVEECINNLRRYHRPVLCTEYMARPQKSTFDPLLGYFQSQNVAAYNWGFVDGKSQTIFPWDSWQKTYTAPPPVWFHDIFHRDGTPYDPKETDYIRRITRQRR
ncbi:MAG TPA: 1,4-beta-xylanase [Verrucomicrobiales bacterium]|nr:1,4-beta-xylanase [Verrucomicrobiales bacterium]